VPQSLHVIFPWWGITLLPLPALGLGNLVTCPVIGTKKAVDFREESLQPQHPTHNRLLTISIIKKIHENKGYCKSLSIYLVLGTLCSKLYFDSNIERQVGLASNQKLVNYLYCL
jgi:hypothetical protein